MIFSQNLAERLLLSTYKPFELRRSQQKSSYQSLVDKLVSLGAGLLVFVNDCGFGGHCNPAPRQASKKLQLGTKNLIRYYCPLP
jgi:hypothetical protein